MMKRTAGMVLLALLAGTVSTSAEPDFVRYSVEQVVRLETLSVEPEPLPGRLRGEPVLAAVQARVRWVFEQQRGPLNPGAGTWRFTEVAAEGPTFEPPESETEGVGRAFVLGLDWMRRLEGQEFSGSLDDLPVWPSGESKPAWLTAWLRWAQTGNFAGTEGSPVVFPAAPGEEATQAPAYEIEWLRSEFRQAPCHVQQVRWTVPVTAAPGSLSPALEAEGVVARTHFSAQSLEWVTQEEPTLVYAERSGVRETYWDMSKVQNPELRELVFRLRLAVQVRVERLP